MKTIILISIFFISNLIFSQDYNNYPSFKNSSLNEIKENSDWKILQEAKGDLNFDGREDIAVILESKDSIYEKKCEDCYRLKDKPRIIIVLLNENDEYRAISQNNEFIARGGDGVMITYLEPEISIENNKLKIYYQFTRANCTYIFEHNKGSIEIEHFKSVGVESATGNYREHIVDFDKNIVTIKKGHISTDPENDEVRTIPFNKKPKVLEELGRMNSWEIVSDVYL